jgi:hypothetical protein
LATAGKRSHKHFPLDQRMTFGINPRAVHTRSLASQSALANPVASILAAGYQKLVNNVRDGSRGGSGTAHEAKGIPEGLDTEYGFTRFERYPRCSQ